MDLSDVVSAIVPDYSDGYRRGFVQVTDKYQNSRNIKFEELTYNPCPSLTSVAFETPKLTDY